MPDRYAGNARPAISPLPSGIVESKPSARLEGMDEVMKPIGEK